MSAMPAPEIAPIPDHVPPELVYTFDQVYADGFDSDPFGTYEKVRAEAPPIFFSPVSFNGPGKGVWYVTRPDDIRRTLQDGDFFTTTMGYGGAAKAMPRRMIPLELDPPDNRKYRLLLTPLFSPSQMRRLESGIRETANELLDKVIANGRCDFAHDFAAVLPATVFMALMGYPMERKAQFLEWEDTFFHNLDFEARAAAGKKIEAMNLEMIGEKRRNPDEGLISKLAAISFDDGTPVPDDDIQDMAWLLFIAGLDTVSSGLSHSFRYLAEHPDKKQELIDDPALIPQAVEELLRWHAWVNPPRTVREDTVLGGVQMKRGDEIMQLHTLANRDSELFEHSMEVDFHREQNPHTAFGGGLHRCVGSHLARQELAIAIKVWLDRVPDYSLPPADRDGLRYNTMGMFALKSLPLEWTPPSTS
ncbi:cytochrome P450 [Jatrophihabitans sp. DSM 45814]